MLELMEFSVQLAPNDSLKENMTLICTPNIIVLHNLESCALCRGGAGPWVSTGQRVLLLVWRPRTVFPRSPNCAGQRTRRLEITLVIIGGEFP